MYFFLQHATPRKYLSTSAGFRYSGWSRVRKTLDRETAFQVPALGLPQCRPSRTFLNL